MEPSSVSKAVRRAAEKATVLLHYILAADLAIFSRTVGTYGGRMPKARTTMAFSWKDMCNPETKYMELTKTATSVMMSNAQIAFQRAA